MTSLPAPPSSVSFPAPPIRVLSAESPVILSAPLPPVTSSMSVFTLSCSPEAPSSPLLLSEMVSADVRDE